MSLTFLTKGTIHHKWYRKRKTATEPQQLAPTIVIIVIATRWVVGYLPTLVKKTSTQLNVPFKYWHVPKSEPGGFYYCKVIGLRCIRNRLLEYFAICWHRKNCGQLLFIS